MNWNTIKLDKADVVFSKYIRLRDKKCVRCGRFGEGELGIKGLQASHFHGRRKETTRFDEENVDALCAGCHRLWGGEYRESYRDFKKEQLTIPGYDKLTLRANTPGKRDRKMAHLYWKGRLKEEFNI